MNESIFERHPLPRYFAVLRPTSGGGPSYQFCEADCETRLHTEHTMIIKNAEIPVDTLRRLPRKEEDIEEGDSKIYEYPMRNASQSDIDIRRVKYWYLPHYFFWNEYKIPVLDFNKRFFLTRSFIRIIPPNTDDEKMMFTAICYDSVRERRLRKIPVSQRGTLETQSEIPQFVMKLLVEDKVTKQESCSISMTPFQDLAKIGVTPCFHIFDALSLSRWISTHHKCPLCRAPTLAFQIFDSQSRN
jgi:hypothetical protein